MRILKECDLVVNNQI